MNKEKLATLIPMERQLAEAAQLDPGKVFAGEDVLPVLTALADAHLEVSNGQEDGVGWSWRIRNTGRGLVLERIQHGRRPFWEEVSPLAAYQPSAQDARSVRFRALLTRVEKAESEVARLKEEREKRRLGCSDCADDVGVLPATDSGRCSHHVALLIDGWDRRFRQVEEVAKGLLAERDQQREDIRRLLEALEEWVDSFDGQKSETHGRMQRPALLAELKERYPKGDE